MRGGAIVIPGNPSDAGPAPQHRDPDATIECANCGAYLTPGGAYRCQGAVPDQCLARLCEDCKQACWSCGLPVCVHHATLTPEGIACAQCAAGVDDMPHLPKASDARAIAYWYPTHEHLVSHGVLERRQTN